MMELFGFLAREKITNRDLWLLAQVYYPFSAVPQNKANRDGLLRTYLNRPCVKYLSALKLTTTLKQ